MHTCAHADGYISVSVKWQVCPPHSSDIGFQTLRTDHDSKPTNIPYNKQSCQISNIYCTSISKEHILCWPLTVPFLFFLNQKLGGMPSHQQNSFSYLDLDVESCLHRNTQLPFIRTCQLLGLFFCCRPLYQVRLGYVTITNPETLVPSHKKGIVHVQCEVATG